MSVRTTKEPAYAEIGMSLDEAVDYIRWSWDCYWRDKDKEHPKPDKHGASLPCTIHEQRMFVADLRDCGWCIAHSHGQEGLEKMFYKCLVGKKRLEKTMMHGIMDKGLSFIAGWMS